MCHDQSIGLKISIVITVSDSETANINSIFIKNANDIIAPFFYKNYMRGRALL